MSIPTSTTFPSSSPPPPTTSSPLVRTPFTPAELQHYLALTATIASPILILLPPRKLDIYTICAGGLGLYGANHLIRERYNGVGFMGLAGQKFGYGAPSSSQHSKPGHEGLIERLALPTEKARGIHEMAARDREEAEKRREGLVELKGKVEMLRREGWGVGWDAKEEVRGRERVVESDKRRWGWEEESGGVERRREKGAEGGGEEDGEGGVAGIIRKVWMGEEKEGWKERRLQDEQKALDEGKGYSDIILDQIWEVWNWDRRKDEDGNWVLKEKNDEKE